MTATAPPDPDADLLTRLLAGDPTASADLAIKYLEPLAAALRQKHRTADDHFVVQAAEDAVLDMIRHPGRFDPNKKSLLGYLRMAADGDLLNAIQKEQRHQRNRAGADSVELVADDRNEEPDEPDGPTFDDPAVAAVIAGFTDAERRFLDLMRAGENRTAALAPVLGHGDSPADVQQAEVKKMRDRLVKRLQRAKGET